MNPHAKSHCLDHKVEGYQLVIHFDEATDGRTVPFAGGLSDCDELVETIKAAVQSRHPILGIPTPPLPRYQVFCTGLRDSIESLKRLAFIAAPHME